jgi:hypothetical protein
MAPSRVEPTTFYNVEAIDQVGCAYSGCSSATASASMVLDTFTLLRAIARSSRSAKSSEVITAVAESLGLGPAGACTTKFAGSAKLGLCIFPSLSHYPAMNRLLSRIFFGKFL